MNQILPMCDFYAIIFKVAKILKFQLLFHINLLRKSLMLDYIISPGLILFSLKNTY